MGIVKAQSVGSDSLKRRDVVKILDELIVVSSFRSEFFYQGEDVLNCSFDAFDALGRNADVSRVPDPDIGLRILDFVVDVGIQLRLIPEIETQSNG